MSPSSAWSSPSNSPLTRPTLSASWQQRLDASVHSLVEEIKEVLGDFEKAAERCRKFYRDDDSDTLMALISSGEEAVQSLQSQDKEYGVALINIKRLQDDWSHALSQRTGDLQSLDARHKAWKRVSAA